MTSVIVPVVRPKNIPKLLEAIEQDVTTEHEVLWEEDKERIGAPKMVRRLTDKTKGEWVCFLGDDTLPESESIDKALAMAEKGGWWLVGLNDQHSKKPTHWLASKQLLAQLENQEFFYTGYLHNFCDDELRMRAERLGKYAWCAEAKLAHNHPVFKTAPMDDDYKRVLNKERWEHDKKLFQERCCKLSVALIVKNEADVIARCLDSVKGADEIVVVDTGSTDKTKNIAYTRTGKIYDFKWGDHFAETRNFALSKCTNDWVLSIDADEYLDKDVIPRLKELMFTINDSIKLKMKSSNNSYHMPRLFRNRPEIKWVGRVHETISVNSGDVSDIGITYTSSPAHALDPERNLRMLEKAQQEEPHNSRTLYYLGREYGYRQDWKKAIETLELYLKLSGWLPERADAYFILAICYWRSNQGEKARQNCLMALNINANFKAACLLMAKMSFEHNAKQWLRLAETATNENTLFKRIHADII